MVFGDKSKFAIHVDGIKFKKNDEGEVFVYGSIVYVLGDIFYGDQELEIYLNIFRDHFESAIEALDDKENFKFDFLMKKSKRYIQENFETFFQLDVSSNQEFEDYYRRSNLDITYRCTEKVGLIVYTIDENNCLLRVWELDKTPPKFLYLSCEELKTPMREFIKWIDNKMTELTASVSPNLRDNR